MCRLWTSTREKSKPDFVICKQQRRTPACASAQSDQRLYRSLSGKYSSQNFQACVGIRKTGNTSTVRSIKKLCQSVTISDCNMGHCPLTMTIVYGPNLRLPSIAIENSCLMTTNFHGNFVFSDKSHIASPFTAKITCAFNAVLRRTYSQELNCLI